ncbi:MAG: hypothetical protein ACTHK5_08495 [Tsuneonella sp.]
MPGKVRRLDLIGIAAMELAEQIEQLRAVFGQRRDDGSEVERADFGLLACRRYRLGDSRCSQKHRRSDEKTETNSHDDDPPGRRV